MKNQGSKKIYIDQSGKIEYTSQRTVLAFSNGKNKTVLINAQDKRIIQDCFREAGKPEMFIYKTFAALLYLLLQEELGSIDQIIIDREYWGKEPLIKDHLLRIIRSNGHIDFDHTKIHFGLVGKESNCHKLAISVLRKEKKPDKIIVAGDILRLVL